MEMKQYQILPSNARRWSLFNNAILFDCDQQPTNQDTFRTRACNTVNTGHLTPLTPTSNPITYQNRDKWPFKFIIATRLDSIASNIIQAWG
ncbi:hypothetical protein BYT27DRAFT_7199402 [Phlegmacium glaucopus]|nr:hypothetical protein BYT27DRAFT_7199402 [Phlegmacium glaucopus]